MWLSSPLRTAVLIAAMTHTVFGVSPGDTSELRPAGSDLPELIRHAKADYQPVGERELRAARQSLERAKKALDEALKKDPQANEWKQLLRWEVLEAQLAVGRTPDPVELRQVRQRFVGDRKGLEMPQFTDVRAALGNYLGMLEDAANPDAQRDFETQLDALAAAVEACQMAPRPGLREEIAQHLGWLEQRNQAAQAVHATRQALSHPNLRARLPQQVIAKWLSAEIDSAGPVRDVILGSQIHGTERTVGAIAPVLVPDTQRAIVQMELTATSRANTVACNGPVRVYQNSDVAMEARKQIILDQDGIRTLPAESAASIESQLSGVGTTCQRPLVDRVVRRKACRRANRQQDQANCIAESHQRQRLNEKMDHDVDAQLAAGNAELNDRFFHPLTRHDVRLRSFLTETSQDSLYVLLELAAMHQLGAASDPPGVETDASAAVIQVHASAVDNYAAAAVGGQTFTAQQISRTLATYAGTANRAGGRESGDDVSVTLDPDRPVTLNFEASSIVITIHGQRYVSRKKSFPAMNVSVRYRLELVDGEVRVVLAGEPDVVPPRLAGSDLQGLSAREVTLRRLLLGQLERQLPKEMAVRQFAAPEQSAALADLNIVRLTADHDWLTVAFQ